jgi:hypothetical protein
MLGSSPTECICLVALGYFTEQRLVALEYAQWARQRQRQSTAPIGIVRLVVPQSLLVEAGEISGNDFKAFAWYNRQKEKVPQHLPFYVDGNVLIDPIVRACTRTAQRGQTRSC